MTEFKINPLILLLELPIFKWLLNSKQTYAKAAVLLVHSVSWSLTRFIHSFKWLYEWTNEGNSEWGYRGASFGYNLGNAGLSVNPVGGA